MRTTPGGSRAGYTLVEVLLAVSVLILALAIVAPPGGARARGRLAAPRAEILSAHTYARALAVQHGRPTRLLIQSAAGGRVGESRDGWLGALTVMADTGSGQEPVRSVRIRSGSLVSTRTKLCFDGRGFPEVGGSCEPADATMILRQGAAADTLRFSPGGEPLP